MDEHRSNIFLIVERHASNTSKCIRLAAFNFVSWLLTEEKSSMIEKKESCVKRELEETAPRRLDIRKTKQKKSVNKIVFLSFSIIVATFNEV